MEAFQGPKKPEMGQIKLPTWLPSTACLIGPRIHALPYVTSFESSSQTSPRDEREIPAGNSDLGDPKIREKGR